MPAINFSMFKGKILDGSKAQTIRRKRKRPIVVGDKLYLLWGQRSAMCERLGESTCVKLQDFEIDLSGQIYIDTIALEPLEVEFLAIADGFRSGIELINFFTNQYGLPFIDGVIIFWNPKDIKASTSS